MARERRSAEALRWRKLYDLTAWKVARREQLARSPLCERCERHGIVTRASVVNHRKPHKGDLDLFFDPANHQSLCAPCHDQAAQADEKRGVTTDAIGFSGGADPSGWPSDPRHPANRIK